MRLTSPHYTPACAGLSLVKHRIARVPWSATSHSRKGTEVRKRFPFQGKGGKWDENLQPRNCLCWRQRNHSGFQSCHPRSFGCHWNLLMSRHPLCSTCVNTRRCIPEGLSNVSKMLAHILSSSSCWCHSMPEGFHRREAVPTSVGITPATSKVCLQVAMGRSDTHPFPPSTSQLRDNGFYALGKYQNNSAALEGEFARYDPSATQNTNPPLSTLLPLTTRAVTGAPLPSLLT